MSKCPLWPDNEVDKLPKVTCILAKKSESKFELLPIRSRGFLIMCHSSVSLIFFCESIIMLSGSTTIIITFRRRRSSDAGPFYRHALKQ